MLRNKLLHMKRRILFLCTGNSVRSQIAEALLQLMVDDHFEAASAGTHSAIIQVWVPYCGALVAVRSQNDGQRR